MIGITSYGAYLPRRRLTRHCVTAANNWGETPEPASGRDECAVAAWDEDSITMAVEAARDALLDTPHQAIDAIFFGSTTLPFMDRQNAGILVGALAMRQDVTAVDLTGSRRAGTAALSTALDSVLAGTTSTALAVASDMEVPQPGSSDEMLFGHGAAAVIFGNQNPIAEVLCRHAVTTDFVDHYRSAEQGFSYHWEDRWIRDEGVLKIVPAALSKAMQMADLEINAIDRLILSTPVPRAASRIASAVGIPADRLADDLIGVAGRAGCAHPIIVLAHELERARASQTIAVAVFGQGCDVVILRTTDRIESVKPRRGVAGHLANRQEETEYVRYLSLMGLLQRDEGKRAEIDNPTSLSQLYRRQDMIHGLIGGVCGECGTRQFPQSRYCVAPDCHALDTQEPISFAETPAKIITWSADHLTYCPDPPLLYGMIRFEGGGQFLANFADMGTKDASLGLQMRMVFRIKDFDRKRSFRRYFWKAAPDQQIAGGRHA